MLDKLKIRLSVPNCKVSILLKRGDHKSENNNKPTIVNQIADFKNE